MNTNARDLTTQSVGFDWRGQIDCESTAACADAAGDAVSRLSDDMYKSKWGV